MKGINGIGLSVIAGMLLVSMYGCAGSGGGNGATASPKPATGTPAAPATSAPAH